MSKKYPLESETQKSIISYNAYEDFYTFGDYKVNDDGVFLNGEQIHKNHFGIENELEFIKTHTNNIRLIGEINLFLRGLCA